MAAPGVDPLDKLRARPDAHRHRPPEARSKPLTEGHSGEAAEAAETRRSRPKKVGVDPADFLALRAELIEMKARLDESEQARALVEARLELARRRRLGVRDGAQRHQRDRRHGDATAASRSPRTRNNSRRRAAHRARGQRRTVGEGRRSAEPAVRSAGPAPKIAEFEAQIAQLRSELESANCAAAEAAALPPPPPPPAGPDPETLERIAAVQQRVNDLDQIRHRLGEIDISKQRMGEIDQLHQRVAGVETSHQRIGELDDVEQRLATVDGLAAQLQQLNARVAAQAELGGQLSTLRDASLNSPISRESRVDDDIRLQLQEIGERLRSTRRAAGQVGQLAERATANDTEARAVREHMAVLDQRLTNVSTELANQLSELGRDIDGLGQRVPEVAEGTVSDEVVDALRGGQVKLANEQARYEIAFRQDLAALAELLRTAERRRRRQADAGPSTLVELRRRLAAPTLGPVRPWPDRWRDRDRRALDRPRRTTSRPGRAGRPASCRSPAA